MKKFIAKLYGILDAQSRFSLLYCILLMGASSLLESITVVSVIPFIQSLDKKSPTSTTGLSNAATHILELTSQLDRNQIVLSLGIVIILSSIARMASLRSISYISARIGNYFSKTIYSTILSTEYAYFFQLNKSEINSIIANQVNYTIMSINYCLQFVSGSISLAFFMATFFAISPNIAVITLSILCGSYFGFGLLTKKILRANSSFVSDQSISLLEFVQETFFQIENIILSSSYKSFLSSFSMLDWGIREKQAQSIYISSISKPIIETCALIIILVLSIWFANQSSLTSAITLIAFIGFLVQKSIPSLQQLYNSWTSVKSYESSNDLIFRYLQSAKSCQESKDLKFSSYDNFKLESIELFNAGYTYPGSDVTTFRQISLKINAGDVVAILGKSGSGKTTLLNTIASLIHPTEGKLKINNRSLRDDYEIAQLYRRSIAYVPQDSFIVNDTIAANVSMNREIKDYQPEKIWKALGLACLEEFVKSLPNGLDTRLGHSGIMLSGGQEKRLCIARALYRGAQILILDEPTSGTDADTEQLIMDTILNFPRKVTVIFSTHSKDSSHIPTKKIIVDACPSPKL
jgi:ABC-type multidrug transport system fused ATPase/permease subunit